MSRTTLIAVLASAVVAAAAPRPLHAEKAKTTTPSEADAMPAPIKSGHAAIAGVNYYYEVRGEGEPLLLLHGGLGSIDMFGPILPALWQSRQVIAVDLHGHGRTPLGTRNIDLIDIGNDLAALLKQLGYTKVDVLGYSFGGGAAFRLAVQHPDLARRVALVSAGYSHDGFYPEIRAQQVVVFLSWVPEARPHPLWGQQPAVSAAPRIEVCVLIGGIALAGAAQGG